MVQPLTLLYTILAKKVTPFVYLFLINGTLYLCYFFILPHKMYKEKNKKLKYTTEQNWPGSQEGRKFSCLFHCLGCLIQVLTLKKLQYIYVNLIFVNVIFFQ